MLENKGSITAKICAFARAHHSYYNRDKIFDDYLAFDLLGDDEYEHMKALTKQRFSRITNQREELQQLNHFMEEYISPIPLSRICYTERKLLEFTKEHGSCQYVICGAGLDTFAFRNDNPSIEIFELDHPLTQKHKIERIKSLRWKIPENVHFVPIDFLNQRIDETLLEAGFVSDKKTFFGILGVSYYLSLDTLRDTFLSASNISSPGSLIVFDYPDDNSWKNDIGSTRIKKIKALTEELGEKMTDGFDYHDLEKALRSSEYEIVDYQSPKKIQEHYFRNRKDNLRAFENVHFITAELAK
ncbi:class I SAM-dependent methyltransferase [Anaeromicropila herbilytica]|uniref:S-adenosyl-L-methionine-dependent methyltransferase n=1 Tax=Anaeromicropila herbilytica TaxID=2785025 RepID=A0A7R7EKZ7_9FIRM|nr:class I SAM-dependent methyltransferase [Anaeromicropila herbilytica]BCN30620.1 putative S-adenosyl-L-methionine-dependent methyltransferase YktD [Anaeromicropila herbilytica]